ncbi:hypothetical protein FKM82_021770 [Ascaphus truei]
MRKLHITVVSIVTVMLISMDRFSNPKQLVQLKKKKKSAEQTLQITGGSAPVLKTPPPLNKSGFNDIPAATELGYSENLTGGVP